MNTNMNITEHMEVIGSDGEHIGTVDKVEGDAIKLTRKDSPDGQHHRIPITDVDLVEDNRVRLRQTSSDVQAKWQSA